MPGMSACRSRFFCRSDLVDVLCKTMQVYAAETEGVQAETVADGTYTINGVLRHAVQDQDSMGNTAISKPMTLQVSGGNCQLVLDLVPLTIRLGKKDFNGYLAETLYYPDVDGRVPTESDAASASEILEQYDGVYDSYNDPENGLDENVKGMIYPKKSQFRSQQEMVKSGRRSMCR